MGEKETMTGAFASTGAAETAQAGTTATDAKAAPKANPSYVTPGLAGEMPAV